MEPSAVKYSRVMRRHFESAEIFAFSLNLTPSWKPFFDPNPNSLDSHTVHSCMKKMGLYLTRKNFTSLDQEKVPNEPTIYSF